MNTTIIAGATAIALTIPAFAGTPAACAVPEAAPSLGISGDLSLGYQSDFEYRGLTLDSTPWNSEAIVADINVAYAFNDSWSAVSGYRLDSLNDDFWGDFEQSYIGAVWSNERFSAELGYRYIDMGGLLGVSSNELYLDLGTVCPWTGAKVNLLWAHDLDETEGDYFQLSAVKSFELNDWASVELGAGVSYSREYWGDDSYYTQSGNSTDWNHWYLGVALPLKATETLTVTPYVTFNEGLGALDIDGLDASRDQFIYGVKAAVKF